MVLIFKNKFIKMDCKICELEFEQRISQIQEANIDSDRQIQQRVPRIITDCGHTVCQACLCQAIKNKNNDISCPECNQSIFNQDIQMRYSSNDDITSILNKCFPINKALLQLQGNGQNLKEDEFQQIPVGKESGVQSKNSFEHLGQPSKQSCPSLGLRAISLESRSRGEQDKKQMCSRISQLSVIRRSKVKRGLSYTSSCNDKLKDQCWDQDISIEPQDYLNEHSDGTTPHFALRKDRQKQLQTENAIHTKRKRIMTCITQQSVSQESDIPSDIANQTSAQPKCRAHTHKKVEAFCETCLQVLCIDCILKQGHKNHEMLSLGAGCQNQKEQFNKSIEKIDELKYQIENKIYSIKSHLKSIEENAQQQREKISSIFNEVRQKIICREQILKKRISDTLESEQVLFKQRIQNLNDQIKCIEDVKNERKKLEKESEISILLKAKLRQELIDEASKELENHSCAITLPDIQKESEIAHIVQQIVPKKIRQQVMAGALTQHVRITKNQESIRLKELSKNQKELEILLQGSSHRNDFAKTRAIQAHQTVKNTKNQQTTGSSNKHYSNKHNQGGKLNRTKDKMEQIKDKGRHSQSPILSQEEQYKSPRVQPNNYHIKKDKTSQSTSAKKSRISPHPRINALMPRFGFGQKQIDNSTSQQENNSGLNFWSQTKVNDEVAEQTENTDRVASEHKAKRAHTVERGQQRLSDGRKPERPQSKATSNKIPGLNINPIPLISITSNGNYDDSASNSNIQNRPLTLRTRRKEKSEDEMKRGKSMRSDNGSGTLESFRLAIQLGSAFQGHQFKNFENNSPDKKQTRDKNSSLMNQNQKAKLSLDNLKDGQQQHKPTHIYKTKIKQNLKDFLNNTSKTSSLLQYTKRSLDHNNTISTTNQHEKVHEKWLKQTMARNQLHSLSGNLESLNKQIVDISRMRLGGHLTANLTASKSNGGQIGGQNNINKDSHTLHAVELGDWRESRNGASGQKVQVVVALKTKSNKEERKGSNFRSPRLISSSSNQIGSPFEEVLEKKEDEVTEEEEIGATDAAENSNQEAQKLRKQKSKSKEKRKMWGSQKPAQAVTRLSKNQPSRDQPVAKAHYIRDAYYKRGQDAAARPSTSPLKRAGSAQNNDDPTSAENSHNPDCSIGSIKHMEVNRQQVYPNRDKYPTTIVRSVSDTLRKKSSNKITNKARIVSPNSKGRQPVARKPSLQDVDLTNDIAVESSNTASNQNQFLQRTDSLYQKVLKQNQSRSGVAANEEKDKIEKTDKEKKESAYKYKTLTRRKQQPAFNNTPTPKQQLVKSRQLKSTKLSNTKPDQDKIAPKRFDDGTEIIKISLMQDDDEVPNDVLLGQIKIQTDTDDKTKDDSSKDKRLKQLKENKGFDKFQDLLPPAEGPDGQEDEDQRRNQGQGRKGTEKRSGDGFLDFPESADLDIGAADGAEEDGAGHIAEVLPRIHLQGRDSENRNTSNRLSKSAFITASKQWSRASKNSQLLTVTSKYAQQDVQDPEDSQEKNCQEDEDLQNQHRKSPLPFNINFTPQKIDLTTPKKELQMHPYSKQLSSSQKRSGWDHQKAIRPQSLSVTSHKGNQKVTSYKKVESKKLGVIVINNAKEMLGEDYEESSSKLSQSSLNTSEKDAENGETAKRLQMLMSGADTSNDRTSQKSAQEIKPKDGKQLKSDESRASRESFDIATDENEDYGGVNQQPIEIQQSQYAVSHGQNKNRMSVRQNNTQKFMSKFEKSEPDPPLFASGGKNTKKSMKERLPLERQSNGLTGDLNQIGHFGYPRMQIHSKGDSASQKSQNSSHRSAKTNQGVNRQKENERTTEQAFSSGPFGASLDGQNQIFAYEIAVKDVDQIDISRVSIPLSPRSQNQGQYVQSKSLSFLSPNCAPIQDFGTSKLNQNNGVPTQGDRDYKSYISAVNNVQVTLSALNENDSASREDCSGFVNQEEVRHHPSFVNVFRQNRVSHISKIDQKLSQVLSQSQVSSKFDQSELYRVKEEYIFVFGGQSNGSSEEMLSSVEVIDVQREICRLFTHQNQQNDDKAKDIHQICAHEVGKPICNFNAIQFQFKKKFKQFSDKIFLLGGQDQFGNILRSVYEFNVDDMKVYEADWKLPKELTEFGLACGQLINASLSKQESNSAFLAGGQTRNKQYGKIEASKNVYRIFAQQNARIDENNQDSTLGHDMQSNLLYKYEDLPDMICARSKFSLLHVYKSNQQYELYAVGGLTDSVGTNQQASFIEKYDSQTHQWQLVKVINEINLQISQIRGHQALYMADGSIYILGGCLEVHQNQEQGLLDSLGLLQYLGQGQTESSQYCLNTLLKFDIKTNKLTMLPPMNQPRANFQASLSSNLRFIYVAGGVTNSKKKDAQQYLKSIEKYDVFEQKWQLLAPLSEKRAMHAGCQVLI